jgi:hypothetical protein
MTVRSRLRSARSALRRSAAPTATGVCAYCRSPLLPCPDCHQDWRATRCTSCGLGLRCPTHHSYWLAH